jgi:hypothetical protein
MNIPEVLFMEQCNVRVVPVRDVELPFAVDPVQAVE